MTIEASALKFRPREVTAARLLPFVFDATDDASHDLSHLFRVWRNVKMIAEVEGGDWDILIAAAILHDCVPIDKNSPLRPTASRLAAAKASEILAELNWSAALIADVAHAIEAHSFSAKLTPLTLEAKILQDADRLDAIGAVGVARCFYVSGRLNRPLYHMTDPQAHHRPLDDTAWSLDHFETKLLRLADGFTTDTGGKAALARHQRMKAFVKDFCEEIEIV